MILDDIVASNLKDLSRRKEDTPLDELKKMATSQISPLDFARALSGGRLKLVTEVKKASPSRGIIRNNLNPTEIACTYASNGASAISVLTESRHFQGKLDYLKNIRKALGKKEIPLLRKDFLTDVYEIYEARAYGADCLLLIVAILKPEQLRELLKLSHKLGMQCLVEVHNEQEVETALASGAEIIGINNRDLKTFNVDLTTTERLRPLIPPGKVVVSESGIRNRSDLARLASLKVNAALVGETLMSAPDIAAKMKELLQDIV